MAVLHQNEIFFTAFEPKQANRFILFVDGFPSYIMKGVSAVSVSQGSVPLNHINVQRYVKGKTRWQPLEITLYDPIVPSASQQVIEWVRLHHESVTGRDGYADFYKKDITFNLLDPVGAVVEEWELKGAYIQSANFGDLAFDSSDPVEISLTLRYDYAVLKF